MIEGRGKRVHNGQLKAGLELTLTDTLPATLRSKLHPEVDLISTHLAIWANPVNVFQSQVEGPLKTSQPKGTGEPRTKVLVSPSALTS